MENFLIWKILGIEETKDIQTIKTAYHKHLKTVNPEDDQAGFMELRQAYEQALFYAEEADKQKCDEDEYEALKNGSEADRFIYQMNILYQDLELRISETEWDSLLRSYEDDLDGELQERVLVYIMSHHHFPWNIWKRLDEKFHFVAETELLKEKFPENFIKYITYYITHDAFIDFDIFEGETDRNVDDYINRYLDLKGRIENFSSDMNNKEEADAIRHEFKVLSEYNIYHPYIDAEKLRFYLMLKDIEPIPETAIELADRLSSDYPDIFYVSSYAGLIFLEFKKISAAKAVFEHLTELDENAFWSKMGMLKIQIEEGKYAEAKENCLDLLDTEERNAELNRILEQLNEYLVPLYEEKLLQNPQDSKNIIELGWCYFQQQKFEDVERILTSLPGEQFDEYDYINLIGRNYLAMDQYEKAVDYLIQWREMIDKTEDDGSKDSKKRLNRKGFAHFAVGLAHWKLGKKEEGIAEIEDGIHFEYADGYRMSYCDELAQIYLEEKKYDKVYEICNELLKQDDGFYPAYLRRQEAAFELHNGQDVIDDFYSAKRIYAGYVKPYVYAMRVFFYAGQYQDALNIYEQAEDENLQSDEMKLLYFKIKRILNRDDVEQLRSYVRDFFVFKKECLQKKIADNNRQSQNENAIDHPEAYTDLETFSGLYLEDALYRVTLDDRASALFSIEEGLIKYPDNVGLLELKADIFWDEEKYDEAFDCYKELLDLGYDAPSVYIMIGKYYKMRMRSSYISNADQAMENFKKAYELEPENPECLYYLSRLNRQKFRYFSRSLSEDDEKNCYQGGQFEDRRREALEEAVFYAKKLYEQDENAFNAIELGLSYELGGEFNHAMECYKKAAMLEPDNIYAHNNAGNLYLRQNKLQEAKRELLLSAKLEQDDEPTAVYELLADVYEQEQDYQAAAEWLNRQLERNPKDKPVLERLKYFYEKMKDCRKVILVLEKLYEYGFIKKYELCYYSAKYNYLDGKKWKAIWMFLEALSLTNGDKTARKKVLASKAEWKNDRK